MPLVDYNRIYKVRSRERQPVLYSPGMIPDAAGATMRAGMPALNARLADVESRAREKQGNIRAQFAAIGDLIGVGAKVGDAYARAIERRDEADFNALAAAWQNHMNDGADKAWKTPRTPNGKGGWTGPSVAIRDLDKAFDGTEAFETARAGVKERFQKWRAEKSRTYFRKADQAQADQADAYKKAAWAEYWTGRQDELKQYYDPGDAEEWRNTVNKLAPELADAVVQKEIEEGTPVLPGHRAGLEKELRAKFTMERYAHWCNLFAASDKPMDGDLSLLELEWAALSPEEREKQKDKFSALADWKRDGVPDLDDAQRFALKKQVEAAKSQRERNFNARENEIADQAKSVIDAINYGDVSNADLETARTTAENAINSLAKPDKNSGVKQSGRAAYLSDKLDEAVSLRKTVNFATAWNGADKDGREELDESIKTMPEGRAKDAIVKWRYGGSVGGGSGKPVFDKSNATALLVRSENNPTDAEDVHTLAAEQFNRDGNVENYAAIHEEVRKFANFRNAAKQGGVDNADAYVRSIQTALEGAFGVSLGEFIKKDKNGKFMFDKDGNPVPVDGIDPNEKRRSTVGQVQTGSKTIKYGREAFVVPEMSEAAKLSNATLLTAYSLGVEYITQRLEGFDGKGGKGKAGKNGADAITPQSAVEELTNLFKSALADYGERMNDEILFETVLSMRNDFSRLGVPKDILDEAERRKFARALEGTGFMP